jgi:hypothetical protein
MNISFNCCDDFVHLIFCLILSLFNQFHVARHSVRIGYLWHRSQRESLVGVFLVISMVADQSDVDSRQ